MKIAKDKKLHLLFSALITIVGTLSISTIWGLIIGASAGLAKEFIWDLWMKKGVFDKMDLVFNGIGIAIGLLISILIKLL